MKCISTLKTNIKLFFIFLFRAQQHYNYVSGETKGKQSFLCHNHLIIKTWPPQNKKSRLGFRSREKQSHWVKADEVAEGFDPSSSEPMRVKPGFSFSPQSRRRWGLLMEQQCIVGVSPVRKQCCWWVAWWEAAVAPQTMEEMHIRRWQSVSYMFHTCLCIFHPSWLWKHWWWREQRRGFKSFVKKITSADLGQESVMSIT